MDERLCFLARAAARHWLVENGEMELDEAFGGLVDDMNERRAIERHFDVIWRKNRDRQLQAWRAEHGPNRMLRVRKAKGNKSD